MQTKNPANPRVLAALTLMAMLLGASTVWAQQNNTANNNKPTKTQKLFQDGRKAMLTGNYDAAIKLLKQAVDAKDAKTSYRLYLARAYRYADKPQLAEAQLKVILKSAPDHVEAGQLLGQIFAGSKDWKNTVKILEPLLQYRHDYTTYQLLAEAFYNLDDHKKARKYYKEAIKLNPKNATDHYRIGNIHLASNSFALAADSYQKALNLNLDSPVLRYKLGSAYFNLRNYFGKVSVVTVKAGKIGTINGNWYLIEPEPGKKDTFRAAPSNSAIYQVARAIADGIKDRPDIHFLKANIYLNAHRYKRAYEMFANIRETIPKEDKALFFFYYSQAAFGINKYDEYISLLGEAIKLDKDAYEPTLVEAYLKVAGQHNQAGDFTKYIEFLEKAVNASPQTTSLHLSLGNAYQEARQYAKAVLQWRLVLDLEPDHPDRTNLLNKIAKYRRMTKPAKAPSKPAKPKKGVTKTV
ncbi:MAG: tetratricopeptide repeat protein [Phycisphaerales bacterium]|nr:tetratricopeptide repeat protein [Phycisphaerales bacterium]